MAHDIEAGLHESAEKDDSSKAGSVLSTMIANNTVPELTSAQDFAQKSGTGSRAASILGSIAESWLEQDAHTQPEASIFGAAPRQSYEITGSGPPASRGASPPPQSPILPIPENLAIISDDEEADRELGKWLVALHRRDLFSAVKREDQKPGSNIDLKLSFAALNRMRMRKLQVKLVQRILRMRYEAEEPEDWEELLKNYIQATKDNDYIRECVARGRNDPFVVTSERMIDAEVLRLAFMAVPDDKRKADGLVMRQIIQDGAERDVLNLTPPLEKNWTSIGGTRTVTTQKEKTRKFLGQLAISIGGGAFLVAPMWLMVLHNTQYTSLITTSACVCLCGVVAAWVLDNRGSVLATSAAYAAVLVVFVGTSTPSSS